MKVIFLRHGQTSYNLKGLINQDPNIEVPLTSLGRKQAVEAKRKLGGIEFDVVFVSEFLRAKQTAEIVTLGREIPIYSEKRVNEARVGFEGQTAEEHTASAKDDPYEFKVKDGESWHDVKARVKDFLDWLKKEDYENVLVVTHQWLVGVANEIINNLSDGEARHQLVENCEFFEFEL